MRRLPNAFDFISEGSGAKDVASGLFLAEFDVDETRVFVLLHGVFVSSETGWTFRERRTFDDEASVVDHFTARDDDVTGRCRLFFVSVRVSFAHVGMTSVWVPYVKRFAGDRTPRSWDSRRGLSFGFRRNVFVDSKPLVFFFEHGQAPIAMP